jgi:hypothetical protein
LPILALLLLVLLIGTASAHPKSATLHFTRSTVGWILIPAKVNGHAGIFVFDTGAVDSFISPKLIGENTADPVSRVAYLGGTGTFRQVSANISLGENNLALLVMLGSTENLSVLAKTKIDGIIGLSVLGQYKKITIDLKTQTVTLEE